MSFLETNKKMVGLKILPFLLYLVYKILNSYNNMAKGGEFSFSVDIYCDATKPFNDTHTIIYDE